jgi:alcohol dehydrogenase class IV
LPTEVPVWSLGQLKRLRREDTRLCVTPSCRDRVLAELNIPVLDGLLAAGQTLVVAGGGALMDQWKVKQGSGGFELVCVPTIYGSGAEVSPIVVLNTPRGKQIEMDDRYMPHARVYWPELLATVPMSQARDACGDVWSHALEAFMSPLAEDGLRGEIAVLVSEMLDQPLQADSAWFDFSARACTAQSRCSVGLIHGIAHSLEHLLNDSRQFGHAALCAILLWPVLRFNREHAEKWTELVSQFEVDESAIEGCARALFDPERFEPVRRLLGEHWKTILRDPCTRTNGVLVRRGHADYFLNTSFT